ncbi:MAG TPA: HD domain-containing protein [Solirubrobacteraceae bacterium]|jgi:3'-5' exoribonuclease|nr:HD domain-containing protein [Solirubrobacteraceae bacterium]
MQVRELREGSRVAGVLLLRGVDVRRRREGEEYLKLTLGNRTGILPAVVLDDVAQARAACRAGEVVHVVGVFSVHPTHGGRLVVEAVRRAQPDEYDPDVVLDGPTRPAGQMEADLRELVGTVQDVHLRRLLEAIFGHDAPTWPLFRDAPAAKHYHQAYRHGLLEHSLTVAQAVSAISATFPGIDRDVAVTGALLHDIGKLDAYELRDDGIEMSDQGRLYGEIPLGYYRVRSLIESLDGFPQQTGQAVLHIILSHHGSLEHGSPVIPCTREATLVHMADNLGGRLGSFDRIEKALPAGSQWSSWDKGIGGGAYFASPAAAPAADERRAA